MKNTYKTIILQNMAKIEILKGRREGGRGGKEGKQETESGNANLYDSFTQM